MPASANLAVIVTVLRLFFVVAVDMCPTFVPLVVSLENLTESVFMETALVGKTVS